MKLKSLFSVAIASLATSFVFADQGDAVITFSTPGVDKYADGVTVADDEWYALCWSVNDNFGGFKTDGSALVAGDEVVLKAPLAKGGHCPFTAFEFARDAKYDTGKFFVILLDTRDASGAPAKTLADVFVKNGTVATSVKKGGAMSATTKAESAVGGASVAWATPTVLGQAQIEKLESATISSFKVVDANVQITVEGAPTAGSCFVVRTGSKVDAMNTYEITGKASETPESTTFIVPKEKGNFFSVGTLAK